MVAWRMNPYLRLGQLIQNANRIPGESYIDIFNIEDDELSKTVMQFSEDTCPKSNG